MCVGVPCLVVMACVSMHCLACFELCALEALLFARFSPTANIQCCFVKKNWARAGEWESRIIGPCPWDAGVDIIEFFRWEKEEKDLREARHGRVEKEDRRRTTERARQWDQ